MCLILSITTYIYIYYSTSSKDSWGQGQHGSKSSAQLSESVGLTATETAVNYFHMGVSMGIHQNHPFQLGFSMMNQAFWGTSIYGNPHIWHLALCCFLSQHLALDYKASNWWINMNLNKFVKWRVQLIFRQSVEPNPGTSSSHSSPSWGCELDF